MKIRRNIYLVLGILFIALDILLSIADLYYLTKVTTTTEYTLMDKLAYFAGFEVLLFIGILFFICVYCVQKKIDRQKEPFEDAFIS